ncbi:hypothetical protein GCM10009092_16500 [Bowmanella denitrificans]|uniref:Tetratricopeptide repeat protein 21A/21B C-terminal ARM domain-containing protein n=1 Tax=Bowmanella denitrificans TaxID=366582 RepID=A0ABP3GR71_9ALTE
MKKFLLIVCTWFGLINALAAADFSESYEAANKAYEKGKIEDAFIHLKNALQANPEHLPSRLLMGKVYFSNGNPVAAEEQFESALQLGADLNLVLPVLGTCLLMQQKVAELVSFEDKYYSLNDAGKFDWHLLRGQAYLIQKKPQLANVEFEQAARLSPASNRANNTLAAFYMRHNQLEEAGRLVAQALEHDPTDEKAWQLSGELAYRQGNYQQALTSFHQAHRLDDNDLIIRRGLTQTYFKIGDFANAEKFNQLIIEQTPNDPTANLMHAWLVAYQGDVDKSLKLLSTLSQTLAQLDPDGKFYLGSNSYVHGLSEFLQGNLESSRNILLKHVESQPGDQNALQVLAESYVLAKEPGKALMLLEQRQQEVYRSLNLGITQLNLYLNENNKYRAEQLLRELDSRYANHPALTLGRASLLHLQKKPQQALDVLSAFAATDKSLAFLLLKCKLQLQLGQLQPAQASLAKLQALEANNLAVRNLSAALDIASDRLASAEQKLNSILTDVPGELNATFNLAVLLKKQGKEQASIDLFQKILSNNPSNPQTLLQLADTAIDMGEYAQAQEWLNKLLAYNPELPEANEKMLSIYMARKNWGAALTQVTKLRQTNRLNEDYLLQQARIFIELNNLAGAKNNTDILYDLWLNDAQKLTFLAKVQMQAQDKAGVMKTLHKALELAPRHVEASLMLARAELAADNPDQAEQILNGLDKDAIAPDIRYLVQAEIAIQRQQAPLAAKLLANALKKEPGNQAALVLFYELARQGIAVSEFHLAAEKLVALPEQPAWTRKLLADSYLNHNLTQEAIAHYEAVLDQPDLPQKALVLNNLANLYAATDLDKALTTAIQAYQQGGQQNAAVLDTLGWLHARKGDYSQALGRLREAYVLDSSTLEIRYHLGFVLNKLERKDEARSQLEVAVKERNYPEFENAVLLLDSLKN